MKVVVVGVDAGAVVTFRGQMLREMVEAGHQVVALAPQESTLVRTTLARFGVRYDSAPIHRTGMNPLRDGATLWWLYRRFRRERADCVLVYAAKPVIYGSMAARFARVRLRAAMITGAGSALTGDGSRGRRFLSGTMRFLYAVALRGCHVVFFQNVDDRRLFASLGLLGRGTRVEQIEGSGVDLDRFAPAPLPEGPLTFLLIARLIRDKGILEYVEAARRVQMMRPDTRFQLLGPLDSNPTAMSLEQVDAWRADGSIEYLGVTDDVRPVIAAAHVVVLPSYGEGMPRSILEALAMARPVIVTDVPGCRETVIDGQNGRIVPVRDPTALGDAMLSLVDGQPQLAGMARASRRLAEERFDVRTVNDTILNALGLR